MPWLRAGERWLPGGTEPGKGARMNSLYLLFATFFCVFARERNLLETFLSPAGSICSSFLRLMTLPLRAKLILIMSVVVAGGTVGTALVTQGYVSRVYQRNLEEDFRAEVRYFTKRQFQRLDDIRKQCRKLAADETLALAIRRS